MSDVKFEKTVPVLAVRNVVAAIAFYTHKLGFTCSYTDSPQTPGYAVVGRDEVVIHLQSHAPEEFGHGEGPELRFRVVNVDGLFEEYRTQDVFHSRTTLQDTPWGTREFAFFDPDGNGLFFYSIRQ